MSDVAAALALLHKDARPAELAGMVAEPTKLSAKQMDAWAKDFSSWDVCDQVCGSAFLASPLAWRKVALCPDQYLKTVGWWLARWGKLAAETNQFQAWLSD